MHVSLFHLLFSTDLSDQKQQYYITIATAMTQPTDTKKDSSRIPHLSNLSRLSVIGATEKSNRQQKGKTTTTPDWKKELEYARKP